MMGSRIRAVAAAAGFASLCSPAPAAALLYQRVQTSAFSWASVATRAEIAQDAPAVAVPLPTAWRHGVPFFDNRFRLLRIHRNGFVQLALDDETPAWPSEICGACDEPQPFDDHGAAAAPDYVIAAWWAKWTMPERSSVTYGMGVNGEAFVVSWNGVAPAGRAGQRYSFQLQLHQDGRFEMHYLEAPAGSRGSDQVEGSIGFQPRRGARYAHGTAAGRPAIASRSVLAFAPRPATAALWDADPAVPDVVERWAPEVYADWAPNAVDWAPDIYSLRQRTGQDSRCNSAITGVNFDGDARPNGENNAANLSAVSEGRYRHAATAQVYYSHVETATHHLLGYYFYHPYDCTQPNFGCANEHEHDFGGVNFAVNKQTHEVDALMTTIHGNRTAYRPIDGSAQIIGSRPIQGSEYLTLVPHREPLLHERVAVGIEANTHSIFGRWDDRCIIGPGGTPGACSHEDAGGDGFIIGYDARGGQAQEPTVFAAYPRWRRYSYRLVPIRGLFLAARSREHCGAGRLFSCNESSSLPPFASRFHGTSCDAGDLPWSWSLRGAELRHPCQGDASGHRLPNMLSDPARIFDRWFLWPATRPAYFEVPYLPRCYRFNPYADLEQYCANAPSQPGNRC